MTSAILILMAGSSRRMGRLKAILMVRDRPMLEHALRAAHETGVADVVLVLGSQHRSVTAMMDTSAARVVINEDPDRGMGSSLALGIHALGPGVDRVVVLLGDQPNVDAGLVLRLLELHTSSGRAGAAVSCGGVVMPPVVLSGDLLLMARHATGDRGLRDTLRAQPDAIAILPVEAAAVADIDTPEDLQRVESSPR